VKNYPPCKIYACSIISRKTTTPINMKFQANILTTKMCPATILKIAKSPYLGEKSSDFNKIWCTTADIEPDEILRSTIAVS